MNNAVGYMLATVALAAAVWLMERWRRERRYRLLYRRFLAPHPGRPRFMAALDEDPQSATYIVSERKLSTLGVGEMRAAWRRSWIGNVRGVRFHSHPVGEICKCPTPPPVLPLPRSPDPDKR